MFLDSRSPVHVLSCSTAVFLFQQQPQQDVAAMAAELGVILLNPKFAQHTSLLQACAHPCVPSPRALCLQTAAAATTVSQSMATATGAMSKMQAQMNPAKVQATVQQFAKENAKMEMAQEMMGDTLDSALDDEDTEAETGELVSQVRKRGWGQAGEGARQSMLPVLRSRACEAWSVAALLVCWECQPFPASAYARMEVGNLTIACCSVLQRDGQPGCGFSVPSAFVCWVGSHAA
jgi:hypothetical protein